MNHAPPAGRPTRTRSTSRRSRHAGLGWALIAGCCAAGCQGCGNQGPAGEPRAVAATEASAEASPVRCAVIGGMTDTGFWEEVTTRFFEQTGIAVDVVATGPKHAIAPAFAAGQADLITMHACDTIINLVADGHGENPQPWARNDLLLVGPADDPAGVHGMTDAVQALDKLIEARAKLLIHSSLGAQEVLADLLAAGGLALDPECTVMLPVDKHRQLLPRAAEERAYALVGRIPFLNGKIPTAGLEIMVRDDPRMRRPYVVVAARKPARQGNLEGARRLAAFLRDPVTQAWIAEHGRGVLDDRPLFFPVVVD